jgi:heat shock protein HtpX
MPSLVILLLLLQFSLVSVDQEVAIGREVNAQVRKEMPELRDSEVTAYVRSLGRRLVPHASGAKYPYSFGVVDYREINAFAVPGGPVWLHRGVLQAAANESQVVGVLAHEVAHIANGDMVTMTLLQGVINAFVMFFARIIAFALASRGGERDGRGVSYMVVFMLEIVLGILGSLINAWFSRQREFRADRGGATLAGRDRMLGALKRLASNRELVDTSHQALATLKINGTRGWMVFFSTHPPLEARIAALERFQ